jgi:hypothetical protein
MKIRDGYKIRNIAGENVIVSVGTLNVNLTKVISLNSTSVWLWEQLKGKEFDAEQVAGLLAENYDIDSDTALTDSKAWIESLDKAGLLEN